jgi:hypothetical protein
VSALVQHLREALRDPFADPVTIDGCRIARRLARRFERELAASAEKARLARAELNQISAAGSSTAGDADRCEGRAPEGPIRSAADEAGEEPVNARQPQGASGGVEEAGAATRTAYRIDPPRPVPNPKRKCVSKLPAQTPTVERASRPGAGRSAPATSEPMDVTAGETARTPPARLETAPGGRIDLSAAPSGMEVAAARWRSSAAKPGGAGSFAARQHEAGKLFCRCGGNGNEGGWVPEWFGGGCIERDCPLKAPDRRPQAARR